MNGGTRMVERVPFSPGRPPAGTPYISMGDIMDRYKWVICKSNINSDWIVYIHDNERNAVTDYILYCPTYLEALDFIRHRDPNGWFPKK